MKNELHLIPAEHILLWRDFFMADDCEAVCRIAWGAVFVASEVGNGTGFTIQVPMVYEEETL